MSSLRSFLILLASIALGLGLVPRAEAIVLDWNGVAWTPGSLSNSYNVDPAAAGNDIAVGVTGDTTGLVADPATGSLTPVNNNSLEGGFGPAQKSLLFRTSFVGPNDSLTITITFSGAYTQGVSNVSFTLLDLDKNSYRDRISQISALLTDGVTQSPATISNLGSSVNLVGSGLSEKLDGTADSADTGAGSNAGNATFTFAGSNIRSISFTFDNSAATPSAQEFALGNINFTPIPEINPAFAAAGLCVIAAFAVARSRQRSLRKRSPH
jgi:hypothetical protein